MFAVVLAEANHAIFIPRFLLALGNWSFSIYLVHELVNISINNHLYWTGLQVYFVGFSKIILEVFFTLLISGFSYNYFEIKFQKLARTFCGNLSKNKLTLPSRKAES